MSIFRRRLMIAAAQGKSDGNINYPGLIAAWSAKGKSNDDADRTVLRDLTGNGHDITLNNFAFSEMSGYGGYNVNLLKIGRTSANLKEKTATKIVVNGKQGSFILYSQSKSEIPSYKVKLTGLVTDYAYIDEDGVRKTIRIGEGVHVLPKSHASSTVTLNCGFLNPVITESTENGTIELIPEYPDALVFDGVDDYGINEEMPIQTDYTIIVKREIFSGAQYSHVIGKRRDSTPGAFWFERGKGETSSFGMINSINILNESISWQSTTNYNGTTIKKGEAEDIHQLTIGVASKTYPSFMSMAFYSAYLFDRSLDEQEIKAFIRKYIDADYLLPSEQTTE